MGDIDHQVEAVKIAGEWNKQLSLWATGAVVLSISFMKDLLPGATVTSGWRHELVWSWAFLLLSIILGNLSYGAPITGSGKDNFKLHVNRDTRILSNFQQILFGLGMLLLVLFGANNIPAQVASGDKQTVKDCTCEATNSQDRNHFIVASSADVKGPTGTTHKHTLLLDQKSGQVWQMICSKKSIQFQKIKVEDIPAR